VVSREHALDDHHAHFASGLPDDLARPKPNISNQHLVTVFRCPDDVVSMVEYAVRSEIVSGHPLLPKNETLPLRGSHFSGGEDGLLDSL
jgi:hypothetical protein